jgi:hypothetical protein
LEEVTCAFARNGAGEHLGMAIRTVPLRTLLARLAEASVDVNHVYSDACAAVAGLQEHDNARAGVVVVDRSRTAWGITGPNGRCGSVIRSTLRPGDTGLGGDLPLPATALDGSPIVWTALDLRPDACMEGAPATDGQVRERLAQAEATRRLHLSAAAQTGRIPNLCRAALAPAGRWHNVLRTAVWCVALLFLLLMILTFDLYMQRQEFDRASMALRARQAEVFREALPGRSVPPDPALRLASERVRAEGLAGNSQSETIGHTASSDRYAALASLREFVGNLPSDVRVLLLDWNSDHSQLSVRGRTADHRDAERISECVNRVPNFTARPPHTSRLDSGGVEFTIRAMRESHDDR